MAIGHQSASFEPLTATIGPTGRPVARRMEPKKREKNRRLGVTISRMRRHAPLNQLTPILACGMPLSLKFTRTHLCCHGNENLGILTKIVKTCLV